MTHYDLIIIGGGPAGITAGIYAVRQKLNTLLIAKDFGGQMARKSVEIENYPGFEAISGLELSRRFEKHLRKQKIAIERDSATGIKKIGTNFYITTGSKQKFSAKAVIVASGADPRPLEVPGEKEFIGRGVSYCTTCDSPMFAGKTVAVVGGGNAGFEAAIALSNWAKKIYILEYSSKVGADEVNQGLVKKTKKVKILTDAALKKIKGDKFVNSIIYENRKTNREITLPLEGVFVEIGSVPATGFVKDLVEFNEKDEIKVDPKSNMTKTPGLFVAGDVTDIKWKQIVVAAGEGCKAALSACGYLKNSRQPIKQYE
jgi:alkyl hydroperoxide reductase subunit F